MKKLGKYLLQGILRLLSLLPLRVLYACTGAFAWLLRTVVRYRRDVVLVNLSRSFPDRKYDEIRRIAKRFYAHLGEILAETIWFRGCRDVERFRRQGLVVDVNPEVLDAAFARGNTLMMTSHFGNWELLGGLGGYDVRPDSSRVFTSADVVVVYKPLSSPVWDDIMRVNRCAIYTRTGFEGYVSSGDIMRYALSHRGEKKLYVFPNDQYPYAGSRARDTLTFLHQETKVMLGGAALSCREGMAVLYMSMVPVRRGRYEVSYTLLTPDASSMTPQQVTEAYYGLLEKDLERVPWNYLWTHRRWK